METEGEKEVEMELNRYRAGRVLTLARTIGERKRDMGEFKVTLSLSHVSIKTER